MATEQDAADLRGPRGGTALSDGTRQLAVTAVTTSSVAKDLESSTFFNGQHYQSRFVRLICDQNVFYFWSNESGATVSDTAADATTPNQQGDMLPANTPREEVPAGRYLIVKAAAAGTLRMSIVQTFSRNT